MNTRLIVSSLLLIALGGCTRERPSPIVKLAEESGAGPLDGVSIPAMRHWLTSHPQVATRVDALCTPVRSKATAAWAETTEGRLCVAAKAATAERRFFHYSPAPKDSMGFLPGWK